MRYDFMHAQNEERLSQIERIPILITSSIFPHDTGVKLSNQKERLHHAIESIEQWLRVIPNGQFVLCDGSNFDFAPIIKQRFNCAKIESLFFENNQTKIRIYGRGYGEGEIIRFALNNSKFLHASEAFSKCSSKLWVSNYAECLREWRGDCLFSGVFKNSFNIFKPTEMVQLDTRFYIVRKDFYLQNLANAHQQIRKEDGFGLEDSFYQLLLRMNKNRYLFSTQPVISGVGGGTGKYYKTNRIRVLKEKIRFAIIKQSSRFRSMFNN